MRDRGDISLILRLDNGAGCPAVGTMVELRVPMGLGFESESEGRNDLAESTCLSIVVKEIRKEVVSKCHGRRGNIRSMSGLGRDCRPRGGQQQDR